MTNVTNMNTPIVTVYKKIAGEMRNRIICITDIIDIIDINCCITLHSILSVILVLFDGIGKLINSCEILWGEY